MSRDAPSRLTLCMSPASLLTSMDVDAASHDLGDHAAALDMPAGPAGSPRRGPARLPRLGGLPEGKVSGATLAPVNVNSLAGPVQLGGAYGYRLFPPSFCQRGHACVRQRQRARRPCAIRGGHMGTGFSPRHSVSGATLASVDVNSLAGPVPWEEHVSTGIVCVCFCCHPINRSGIH